jgi:hypothetical protein
MPKLSHSVMMSSGLLHKLDFHKWGMFTPQDVLKIALAHSSNKLGPPQFEIFTLFSSEEVE